MYGQPNDIIPLNSLLHNLTAPHVVTVYINHADDHSGRHAC